MRSYCTVSSMHPPRPASHHHSRGGTACRILQYTGVVVVPLVARCLRARGRLRAVSIPGSGGWLAPAAALATTSTTTTALLRTTTGV